MGQRAARSPTAKSDRKDLCKDNRSLVFVPRPANAGRGDGAASLPTGEERQPPIASRLRQAAFASVSSQQLTANITAWSLESTALDARPSEPHVTAPVFRAGRRRMPSRLRRLRLRRGCIRVGGYGFRLTGGRSRVRDRQGTNTCGRRDGRRATQRWRQVPLCIRWKGCVRRWHIVAKRRRRPGPRETYRI